MFGWDVLCAFYADKSQLFKVKEWLFITPFLATHLQFQKSNEKPCSSTTWHWQYWHFHSMLKQAITELGFSSWHPIKFVSRGALSQSFEVLIFVKLLILWEECFRSVLSHSFCYIETYHSLQKRVAFCWDICWTRWFAANSSQNSWAKPATSIVFISISIKLY